jgi:large subunit ribosomal protein L4e
MSSAYRPQVTVYNPDAKEATQVVVPSVLVAPIRADIVQFVHTQMRKNQRQAYAVSPGAGHQHSAHSWGTGRAVARIPRVSGGGTSRAGQAAFGNMVRKGRMFAPTKTWRRWHRRINTNQKRYAVASALAASAVPALVMARGHRINNVSEVPLVVNNSIESIKKTKDAVALLKAVGAYDDVARAKSSRKVRRGQGKLRENRRYVQRTGPLVVYANDDGVRKAFRNISGVEVANVEALNLLQLAPGGHLGRFIIWSEAALGRLNSVYGSQTRESTTKKGYTLPRNIVSNSDITRIINSPAVQGVVRPAQKQFRAHSRQKKNGLKNLGVKTRLNPYSVALRRSEILAQSRRAAEKAARLENVRKGNKNQPTARQAERARLNKAHTASKKANWARLQQG